MANAAGPHSYSFWAKKGTLSIAARDATVRDSAASCRRITCGVAHPASKAQIRTPAKAGAHRKRCDNLIAPIG
jgi:hypothetical protein